MTADDHIRRIETGIVREAFRARRDLPPVPLLDVMEAVGVPGVSVAVAEGGEIAWARGYGLRAAGEPEGVTPDTMFQAGSISKPVTAVAVMRLVQEGRLDLDRDVNDYLRSWTVPPNGTWQPRITLRHLLCHGAGTTVHGFPGYDRRGPVPTVQQVLDGLPPANTPSVRVSAIPGTQFRYSGGGTTIVQQVLMDVLGRPFPDLMRELVLEPLGMRNSTYEQPLPESRWGQAATGHRSGAVHVDGRWHVYPEMAAAGLWTSPSDLLLVAMDVQRALAGREGTLLSREIAREMVTVQVEAPVGIGFFLSGPEDAPRFGHDGSDEGFLAVLTAFRDEGPAAAVMTNGDWGGVLCHDVLLTIAREYDWPRFTPAPPQPAETRPEDEHVLAGTYQLGSGMQLRVELSSDGLLLRAGEQEPFLLLPGADGAYYADAALVTVTFKRDGDGAVRGLEIFQNDRTLQAQRAEY